KSVRRNWPRFASIPTPFMANGTTKSFRIQLHECDTYFLTIPKGRAQLMSGEAKPHDREVTFTIPAELVARIERFCVLAGVDPETVLGESQLAKEALEQVEQVYGEPGEFCFAFNHKSREAAARAARALSLETDIIVPASYTGGKVEYRHGEIVYDDRAMKRPVLSESESNEVRLTAAQREQIQWLADMTHRTPGDVLVAAAFAWLHLEATSDGEALIGVVCSALRVFVDRRAHIDPEAMPGRLNFDAAVCDDEQPHSPDVLAAVDG
ncbi:MAG: hypothetical protein ACREIA_18380, partial [Opitutaceae bacterium]